MSTPTIKRLQSNYWRVRWSYHRWLQWPVGREPELADGFGWITEDDLRVAMRLVEESQRLPEVAP